MDGCIVRYERSESGALVHLDIKKLGRIVRPGHRISGNRRDTVRGAGWEFTHVAIDDATRWATADVLPDERGGTAVGFLHRTVRCLAGLGVRVRAVMTDNGSCYRARRFRQACQRLGIRHLFTRPYTPRTNGKAERFIKTALHEWAYARGFLTLASGGSISPHGCITTIGIGATPASVATPRSPGSSSLRTTW